MDALLFISRYSGAAEQLSCCRDHKCYTAFQEFRKNGHDPRRAGSDPLACGGLKVARPWRRGPAHLCARATASRKPSWDPVCDLEADIFVETAKLGGLDIRLIYYNGSDRCDAK